MDNFNLKKYLAEGHLFEEKEPIIRAKEYWQDAEYLQDLKNDGLEDIVEWILTNWTGDMPASEFFETWNGFMEVTQTEGGDSDIVNSMLEWHIQKGYMTVDDAVEATKIYWGGNIDDEDLENYRTNFENL